MAETSVAKRNTGKREITNTAEALNIIAVAVKEATGVISSAAREAVQLVASDARDASKLLANNASEAAKIASIKGTEDHDLLLAVNIKLDIFREDIKDLKKTNVSSKDFEELKNEVDEKNEKYDGKIGALETKTANYKITMVLYSIAVGAMIGLIIYHIAHP